MSASPEGNTLKYGISQDTGVTVGLSSRCILGALPFYNPLLEELLLMGLCSKEINPSCGYWTHFPWFPSDFCLTWGTPEFLQKERRRQKAPVVAKRWEKTRGSSDSIRPSVSFVQDAARARLDEAGKELPSSELWPLFISVGYMLNSGTRVELLLESTLLESQIGLG